MDLKDRLDLKNRLDHLYREINRPEFIARDPVKFPHRYADKPDREIAAFLAATIAWGRRDLILKSAERMFALLGPSPHAFVMKGDFRKLVHGGSRESCIRPSVPGTRGNDYLHRPRGLCIHRTFFEEDLLYFCRGLKNCYVQCESLEALFASAENIWEGIALFRETMAGGNDGRFSKHLANPHANSACKRLHLALRWLVRREGPVDLGLWESISTSSLFIPLDVHVGRTARDLGLLEPGRKANDKKAVIALTETLKDFCPEDPVKYDLALFGYSN